MNEQFIKANFKSFTYAWKKDTQTSYYLQEGCTILPQRLSISQKSEITKVRKKGRNTNDPIAGQMIGDFKKAEESPYKIHKPYKFRTQIWQKAEYPRFIGYGTAGISTEEGKVKDTGDLLLFFTPDDWQTIRIFLFAGMGNPNDLLEAFDFANNILNSELK